MSIMTEWQEGITVKFQEFIRLFRDHLPYPKPNDILISFQCGM